jgi:hypothetical protein
MTENSEMGFANGESNVFRLYKRRDNRSNLIMMIPDHPGSEKDF